MKFFTVTETRKIKVGNFSIKNLGEYYDLYVQGDTLLLGDVFRNVQLKCLKIYKTKPGYFISAPGLKKKQVNKNKLEIKTVD